MNRLALVCTAGFLLLTVFAFVDHVRSHELPGKEPAPEPTAPAGAGSAPRTAEPRMTALTVDLDALRARVETQVLEPLRDHRLHRASFSRLRLPDPLVELEMEDSVRPPQEGGAIFVGFRIMERNGRSQRSGPALQLTAGRIDVDSGRIELAPGRIALPSDDAYEDLATALTRLGVRKQVKRPW